MPEEKTPSCSIWSIVFRMFGGFLLGAGLGCLCSSWYIFFIFPDQIRSTGEERGVTMIVTALYGIPTGTILRAITGLLLTFLVCRTRWVGWFLAATNCALAIFVIAILMKELDKKRNIWYVSGNISAPYDPASHKSLVM